jgi:hypothetical protein
LTNEGCKLKGHRNVDQQTAIGFQIGMVVEVLVDALLELTETDESIGAYRRHSLSPGAGFTLQILGSVTIELVKRGPFRAIDVCIFDLGLSNTQCSEATLS